MIKYFLNKKNKLFKFIVIGSFLAFMNILLMYIFVDILNFSTVFLKNLANVIVIEIGILGSFILNKNWTWKRESLKSKKSFIKQIIDFHYVVAFTGIMRISLFFIFDLINLFYVYNTLICILFAAIMNFILYEERVFNNG